MEEKKCRKCGLTKPLDEYYVHNGMFDGHLNICKDCVKKRVGIYRDNNIEKIRAYDRARGRTEERLSKNRARSKLPSTYESRYLQTKKYRATNVDKYRAHSIINNYLMRGKINKETKCCICGSESKLYAHHEDYSNPLDVMWLCITCHRRIHRKYKDE